MCTCDTCGESYQMSRGIYDGKPIAKYELDVCKMYYGGNWDGRAPHHEKKLLAHLESKPIPVSERNAKVCFPRVWL